MRNEPLQRSSAIRAEQNILAKIKILKYWQINGIPWRRNTKGYFKLDEKGDKVLDFYPKSLREFNKWGFSKNESSTLQDTPMLASIFSNGNDTLNKRPDLKSIVQDQIASLKLISNNQVSNLAFSKSTLLKQELKQKEVFIETINTEIVIQYKEIFNLNKQLKKISKQKESYANFVQDKIEKLEKENAELRNTVSLLTKQLNKIAPIKKV